MTMTDEDRRALGEVLRAALAKVEAVPVTAWPGNETMTIPPGQVPELNLEADRDCWKVRAEVAEEHISDVREVLSAAGHDSGGAPIYILVDKAIDAERTSRDEWKKRAETDEAELKGIYRELVERGYKTEHKLMRFNVGSALDSDRFGRAGLEKRVSDAEASAESAGKTADARLARVMELEGAISRIFDVAKKEYDGADIVPY